MLNTILKKRAQALAVILILSVLLTATTALAATKFVKADKGRVIHIAPGVKLVIPPEALEEDTVVSADMEKTDDYIDFYFGPSRTKFAKPAELRITWQAISRMDVDDLTLYNTDGKEIEIEPDIKSWGVIYYIDHFSLYYYRRR